MPFVETDATRVYYEVAGTGPPLVLLHGVGGSGEGWKNDGYLAALNDRFTTIAIDIRGFGRSSRSTSVEDFALARRVEDIRLVLADLAIDRASIFGFSMGGRIAIAFALEYPEAVRALVIGSSNPYPLGANLELAAGRSFLNRLRRLTPRTAVAAARRRIEARLGRPPRHHPDSAYTAEEQAMQSEAGRRGYYNIDLERAVARISMPALFFQGERDDLFASELTRSFADQLLHGEFVLLRGQPHGILEKPALVLPIVAPFLDRHGREARD
jgi:pimeloyl-ACP methyl ester carboxylesterase